MCVSLISWTIFLIWVCACTTNTHTHTHTSFNIFYYYKQNERKLQCKLRIVWNLFYICFGGLSNCSRLKQKSVIKFFGGWIMQTMWNLQMNAMSTMKHVFVKKNYLQIGWTWFYYYKPEFKRQSIECKCTRSNKEKVLISKGDADVVLGHERTHYCCWFLFFSLSRGACVNCFLLKLLR